jgi:hypothetical protein
MSDEPVRKSQRYIWLGWLLLAVGALAVAAEIPAGWVVAGIGGLLLQAGLIGEAVRGPDVPAQPEARRPWERD